MSILRACALALGGSLLAGSAATAEFTGLTLEFVDNDFDLVVCRVYAQFDHPADNMVAVAGTPRGPLEILAVGGGFYQHEFGNDVPPNAAFFPDFPSLEYDSFITIGTATLEEGAPALSPGWPGFGVACMGGNNMGWWVVPGDWRGYPDADGRVLLGQFSIPAAAPPSIIAGRFLMQYDLPSGETRQVYYGFCHDPSGNDCYPGDVNDDWFTNIGDMLAVLAAWGTVGDSPADANGDGVVDLEDLIVVFNDWDETYCPDESSAFAAGPPGPAASNAGDVPFDIVNLLEQLAAEN